MGKKPDLGKNNELPPLPAGAPGIPANNRYREQYGVIVVCKDEQAQQRLYEAITDLKQAKVKVVVT